MNETTALTRFIWESKYRGSRHGAERDHSIEATWQRVADAVAGAEAVPQRWARPFTELLSSMRFLPGGRVLAGAGTGRRVTLFNCFVGRPPHDSVSGIFDTLRETALTLQQGGGVGLDFSQLRPAGCPAVSTGQVASGPVSFLHVWDAMSEALLSTGARRGAMMATLRCDHPDIGRFIDAKRAPGALRNFNLSALISDDFMAALQSGGSWDLRFPAHGAGGGTTVAAASLWEALCSAAHATAEPGVLFVDRINQENNLAYRERISATNPCGEVPLPPYGACNLGSLNLTRYVTAPFDADAGLDEAALRADVRLAVRFLDDVIDASGFALPEQAAQARGCRRLGLGVTGLADALVMLGLRYDSRAARERAAGVLRLMRDEAYAASVGLAAEKGVFPFLDRKAYLGSPFIRRLDRGLRRDIARHGIRNSHLLSIAPAGSISLLAGNVSSGIEPVFMLHGSRWMRNADGVPERLPVADFAHALWTRRAGVGAERPAGMVTASEITGDDHLAMQAGLQPFVDSAIAKTINLPAEATPDQISELFRSAWARGLKGCTVYRSGSLGGQVLQDCREWGCAPAPASGRSTLDADQG